MYRLINHKLKDRLILRFISSKSNKQDACITGGNDTYVHLDSRLELAIKKVKQAQKEYSKFSQGNT